MIVDELNDTLQGVRAVVRRTGKESLRARFQAGRQASRADRLEDAHLTTVADLDRWWCLVRSGIVCAAVPDATAADIDQVAWTLRRTTRVESHTKLRWEARRWWAHALATVLAVLVTAIAFGYRFGLPAWQVVLFAGIQVLAWLIAMVVTDRVSDVALVWVLVGIVTAAVLNAARANVAGPVVVAVAAPLLGVTIIVWVLLVAAGFVFLHPWVPHRWRLRPDPYAVLLNSLVETTVGLSNVRRMDDPDIWQETMLVPCWWNGSNMPCTDDARRLHDALCRPEEQVMTSPQLTTELHGALVACIGDRCPRRDGDNWTLDSRKNAVPDRSYPGPVWSLTPDTMKAAPSIALSPVWELGRAAEALDQGFPAAGPDARRRLKTLGQEVAGWVRDRQLDLQRPGAGVVNRVEPVLVHAIFDVVAGRWENLKATGSRAPIPWNERIGRRAPYVLAAAAVAVVAAWMWTSGEQVAAVALVPPALALLRGENVLGAATGALRDLANAKKP
jgi:hypothetical protein